MKSKRAIVILGPTSSGKSDLAVRLAKKFNGEIISADSRQVYKGLDIGSGKITKKEMQKVPHHLLDVAHPSTIFTASKFQILGKKALADIWSRGKLPIICGGTGFYIQSLVDNIELPDVSPDPELRKKLAAKSSLRLFEDLKKIDPERAEAIGPANYVRLIRAIEIARSLGKVPPLPGRNGVSETGFRPVADFLQIGIKTEEKELKEKIEKRLLARIKKGMIREVENLHRKGVTWKRLEMLGLEYKYCSLFLQGKISREEMVRRLEIETSQYAKKQMRWFKRDSRIRWFALSKERAIEKEISAFLK
jgi:tRNA dimethylallyltransferase